MKNAASFLINQYEFSEQGRANVLSSKRGKDWPVVYLIHNDKELYIGETQNAYNRFEQHLQNPKRKNLKEMRIIFDEEFNKSAVLDIEQSLIQLCVADGKYKLQNMNGGQSAKHNYYQREKYVNKLSQIWKELIKKNMATHDYEELKNSDIFKYSPYNTLTPEQDEVSKNVIYDIIDKMTKEEDGTYVINGGAGTGKTIVLINIINKLLTYSKIDFDETRENDELSESLQLIHDYKKFLRGLGRELKIGYVVPMTSIRKTIKAVFRDTGNGLKANMVIGPFDVLKDDYDIIFVDEAHRLARYKNIGFMGEFKKCALACGLKPEEATQLDMIVKKSKYRVIVYDKNQTVKGSDITDEQFNNALKDSKVSRSILTTQMRCVGGELYTDYINSIFTCTQDSKLDLEKDYQFEIFDDVDQMVNTIKTLDKTYGLCRNAAGYSWEWISKGKKYDEVIAKGLEDIKIGNYKYVWNMTNEEFIISKNAINEIGCIHTLQGYDLNYCGVILGEEIDYNPTTNRIEVDLNKFYDKYVKNGCAPEIVRDYIINSYKVILTRGIKGTFVYACNKSMQDYLKKYIKTH